MAYLNTNKPRRFSPSAEAASREQKRQAHLKTEERNKELPVFMFKGYGFRPFFHARNGSLDMNGPLCPKSIKKDRICLAKLNGENTEAIEAVCEVCECKFDLPYGFGEFRRIAQKAYEGYLNWVESGGEIQTLDTPFEAIKERSEQDTRTIEIKWAQKDGRNMAVIYFIDRESGADKTQMFIDLDREEVRHDASNTVPKKVLAKIIATFQSTDVKIQYHQDPGTDGI